MDKKKKTKSGRLTVFLECGEQDMIGSKVETISNKQSISNNNFYFLSVLILACIILASEQKFYLACMKFIEFTNI